MGLSELGDKLSCLMRRSPRRTTNNCNPCLIWQPQPPIPPISIAARLSAGVLHSSQIGAARCRWVCSLDEALSEKVWPMQKVLIANRRPSSSHVFGIALRPSAATRPSFPHHADVFALPSYLVRPSKTVSGVRSAHCSLSAWFAFLLPSYATFKALAHPPGNQQELQRWGMYWSVIGVFLAVEYAAEWLISW